MPAQAGLDNTPQNVLTPVIFALTRASLPYRDMLWEHSGDKVCIIITVPTFAHVDPQELSLQQANLEDLT